MEIHDIRGGNLNHSLNKALSLWGCYTIIFAVTVAGVFFWFLYQGKTFINEYDALDQGYFWTVELKNNLMDLFSGNGYPDWHWYKGPGMESKAFTDIFALIAVAFPTSMLDVGYTVAIVARLYCSGLSFIYFAGQVKLSRYQALMGGICYTFSTWIINTALVQGQFINITVILPLIIAGAEKIYSKKSPALFMISVAWAMCNSIYLGYMVGICTIMFIFLRYFAHCERFRIKEYITFIVKFIAYGLIGIAASAFIIGTTISTLMEASTGGESVRYEMFKGMGFLLNLMNVFISEGFSFSYENIGLPAACLLVIIVAFRYWSLRNTELIMSVVLIIMTMFPFFSSMFNGFGYVTSRWYFILVFFLVWTAAGQMDIDKLSDSKNLIIMSVWLCVMVGGTFGLAFLDINDNYSKEAFLYVALNIVAAVIILTILALGRWKKVSLHIRKSTVAIVTVITLIVTWNISFNSNTSVDYMAKGQVNDMLARSSQRAGCSIDDDGLYRVDQIYWINIINRADQPSNENLYWKTNSLYLYDSKIPSRLQEFNRLLGNNLSYSKRVYIQSNNNRMGLDFLYGVKYFLGNDTKTGVFAADGCAGYGFIKDGEIDGVSIYKNKYDTSLGFAYDKIIAESEFKKLSRLEREQAILQAMVIPDESLIGISSDKIVKASDIETDIKNVSYSVTDTSNVVIDGSRIEVYDEGGYIEFDADDVRNSQLMLSFDNLTRLDSAGNNIGDFYFSVETDKKKTGANNKKNNQTIAGIRDFDLNLGYYDTFDGKIRLYFEREGIYTFDRLYLSAMNTENFDKYASERIRSKYEVSSWDDEKVSGTISAVEDEFLFFSIPFNSNWSIYIDGKKSEKIIDANVAFVAVEVDKGNHYVELVYKDENKTVTLPISITGIVLIICVSVADYIFRNRKRGKHEKGNYLRDI